MSGAGGGMNSVGAGNGSVGPENNATGNIVGDASGGDDNPAWGNSDGSFAQNGGVQGNSSRAYNYAAPNSAGFPDPAKELSAEYRVMFRRFEGLCMAGNKKIHMKVHGYLIPKKKKLGSRVFRIVDDNSTYVNVKTPHDPVDFYGGDVYPFTFEITSNVGQVNGMNLPWQVFFYIKEDPEPTIFNEELPCEGDLCTAIQTNLYWSTMMAKKDNLDPKDLPACDPSPTQAQPQVENQIDAVKNNLGLQP